MIARSCYMLSSVDIALSASKNDRFSFPYILECACVGKGNAFLCRFRILDS